MDNEIYKIIGQILGDVVWLFLAPLFFMLIWNNIMPEVCGFGLMTYWQSFFVGIGVRLVNGSVAIRTRLDK